MAIIYIIIHTYRNKPINQFLDIYFNYIPVLTHEFGHILFNKLSGGRARDLVIVARPAERLATSQQGYAITQSKIVLVSPSLHSVVTLCPTDVIYRISIYAISISKLVYHCLPINIYIFCMLNV